MDMVGVVGVVGIQAADKGQKASRSGVRAFLCKRVI